MKREELKFLGEVLQNVVSEKAAELTNRSVQQIHAGGQLDHVLHFVAAGVAGQATFVSLTTRADEFVVEHDGRPPTPTQLQSLTVGVPRDGKERHLVLLALGLRAASENHSGAVVVEAWSEGVGTRLVLDSSERKVESFSERPFENDKVRLRISLREQGRLRQVTKLVTRLSGPLPEIEEVRRRCLFAAPDILVGGRPINQPVEMSSCLVWRSLQPPEGTAAPRLRAVSPRHGLCGQKDSGDFSAVLALCAETRDLRGLTMVVDGVCHAEPEADLGFSQACAVVEAPALDIELGHGGLAHNSGYVTLLRSLRRELFEMAEELLAKIDSLPQELLLPAARTLDDLARIYQAREEDAKLEEVYRAGLAIREKLLKPNNPDLLDCRLRLADFYYQRGREEEAAPIYDRAIPVLQGVAENHLGKHRYEEGIAAQHRALELLERISDPNDPELGRRYHEFAEVCRENRSPRAEALYRRAVAIRERREREDPEALSESLYGLADIYRRQKMLSEAEESARRALKLMEEARGESRDLVPFLKLLGQILEGKGDYGASTDLMSRAMMLKYKR
ncbi:MAG: tetratricopeptide repeat protein [Armatimonadetes bacterium]|nr:tetratricopeptide repeat protein [Armatimonadota bacterium]